MHTPKDDLNLTSGLTTEEIISKIAELKIQQRNNPEKKEELQEEIDELSKILKEEIIARDRMKSISPDDGKYYQKKLAPYISNEAEIKACALVQRALLQTRKEFGNATEKDLKKFEEALKKFDPYNVLLLEKKKTKHDQLAVIEELGRHMSDEVKALLHPGTTSYDILDTARSYLLKKVWEEQLRPATVQVIESMINKASELAETTEDGKIKGLQVGRTHLQNTSPVIFASILAGHAYNLTEMLENADKNFQNLKGKISGIVGTGASIEMVNGIGKSEEFEQKVLQKLGLEPDTTATQIIQKFNLANVGHSLVMIMQVIGSFANQMRLHYASSIAEVTSIDASKRLGGSSADASKNNPINYENTSGKLPVVESAMRVLYELCQTDFQRDLRGSVQNRYQPQQLIAQVYESLVRLNRELKQLSIIEENMAKNLEPVRKNPSEALVAILRGEQWVHPEYGVGHDFVKEMAKKAKNEKKNLMDVCFEDFEFSKLFKTLSEYKQAILKGELENYIGHSIKRVENNIAYVKGKISNSATKTLNK